MFGLRKNYASLNSSYKNLYEINDDDTHKLHKTLLEIYDDLWTYCEKHSLKLIAIGGTALGAIRHKGFIPWDDDMDLSLTRDDYEEFIKHFNADLGEKYDLLAPGYEKGANCFLMRVLKKNTTLLNMIDETAPYPSGIYIDITPIDYAPNNKLLQRLKGAIANILRFISYSVYWKQYPSDSLKNFMLNSEGRTYYRVRMTAGTFFSFLRAETWFALFDKFIKGKNSNSVTIAAGRKKYCGELFTAEVFFPLRLVQFEDRDMYVYNDYDFYLRGIYGNYMKIPEPCDREKHLCLRLDFSQGRNCGDKKRDG